MPRLANNELVVGQRYTIIHTPTGYHINNKEFQGVNADGHPIFNGLPFEPDEFQVYAIGDPDIPAQGVVVPVEAPQAGLTPNDPGYVPNPIAKDSGNVSKSRPRKNRTRRNRRKQRRSGRSCRRNSRSCRRNSRSSRRNNMNQHGI